MIQHYVKFYFPGVIIADESMEKVGSRDPEGLKIPKGAYAFQFFSRAEMQIDGNVLVGEGKNYSGIYYVNGVVEELGDIPDTHENKNLLWNMKASGWNRVVKTNCGWYRPFNEGDVIIKVDYVG